MIGDEEDGQWWGTSPQSLACIKWEGKGVFEVGDFPYLDAHTLPWWLATEIDSERGRQKGKINWEEFRAREQEGEGGETDANGWGDSWGERWWWNRIADGMNEEGEWRKQWQRWQREGGGRMNQTWDWSQLKGGLSGFREEDGYRKTEMEGECEIVERESRTVAHEFLKKWWQLLGSHCQASDN